MFFQEQENPRFQNGEKYKNICVRYGTARSASSRMVSVECYDARRLEIVLPLALPVSRSWAVCAFLKHTNAVRTLQYRTTAYIIIEYFI